MPITFPSGGPWYSTEEAAQKMGVTPGHVSRLCKTGKLEFMSVGGSYWLHESVVKHSRSNQFDVGDMARAYCKEVKLEAKRNKYKHKPRILGILAPAAGDAASIVYARILHQACQDVDFELGLVRNELEDIQQRIDEANEDPAIHGIFVFYPIFKDERDKQLKDRIARDKDIEGLSRFWSEKLYANERFVDNDKKKRAILPCTSLGILKTLARVDLLDERAGQTFAGKRIAIFNRSDVVGLPLAYMLKNDGATVFSFDINDGIVMRKDVREVNVSREEALMEADTIITGVPSRAFEKIRGEEIKENTTCLNFSFFQNFEESAKKKAGVYIPRVGPMTIAMCVRNASRLYQNNRDIYEGEGNVHHRPWSDYGTVVDQSELAA